MLKYDMGTMRCADGSSLIYEVDKTASMIALRISQELKKDPIFGELDERLPGGWSLFYFQILIKDKIYPYIRQAHVIRWYIGNGITIPDKEKTVTIPQCGILTVLKDHWDFDDVPIRYGRGPLSGWDKALKRTVKRYRDGLLKTWEAYIFGQAKENAKQDLAGTARTIACHYAEGFDPNRRNDLNWYAGSGIDAKDVLIYFDCPDNITGGPIGKETIDKLESKGFRCVALKNGVVNSMHSAFCKVPCIHPDRYLKAGRVRNPVTDWLVEEGNDLIRSVEYWRSFYKEFGIKVNYVAEENPYVNIPQRIAFDVDGENGGLLAGKQRSEVPFIYRYLNGYHPKHIYFTWNRRSALNIEQKHENVGRIVVTGYPYGTLCPAKDDASLLRSRGAKFIIALFDNIHGSDYIYSTDEMRRYYEAFLSFMIEDETTGIIIKSKKPLVIQKLPEIHTLLEKAVATGRCIRLDREIGRLPFDASRNADLAVGVGISSPVIEAVIAGCKGVHYDITHYKKHVFYEWGYEKIIFDDILRLIDAIKRFKKEPSSEPGLGDWSGHIEELDPFCDRKGGERMGSYMKILFESFRSGKGRVTAVNDADRTYSREWGDYKIVK
ncbi:MAG: hypothetical protein WC481_00620 [Candidatus Omnitrophota bacterium]